MVPAGLGTAGCVGSDEGDATSESTAATDEAAGTGARAAVDVAVSAEWNAIRGRV